MNLEEIIKNYEMSDVAHDVVQKTKLLLVASIAGGGKDTVVRELLKTGDFHRIVSHTTRQPRMNHGQLEVDGQEYHFIDQDTAAQLLHEKAFIEAKYVHGNIYGTSVAEVERAFNEDKVAVTDIDIQGVIEYLDVKPDTHAVFLLPPSVDTWIDRLSRRYEGDLSDHQEELQKRFRTAYDEIKHIQADDRFVLIINDDLETTVKRVLEVLNGTVQRSSGYADKVTEHLIDYLDSKIWHS
jgi:guanylate kinase